MASLEYFPPQYTNNERTPLLPSDRERIAFAAKDHIARFLTDEDSFLARFRRFLQWFLTSKYGHYSVLVLVTLDVAGIFADFLITLHMCEHRDEDIKFWADFDDGLDVMSLVFSSIFVLELLCSIFAFGLGYFKSKFHILDALSILASFLVDVLLHGPLEEAGSLIIVLRLFRVFKIIEESSTAAEETLDELHDRISELEKENADLRRRKGRRKASHSSGSSGESGR